MKTIKGLTLAAAALIAAPAVAQDFTYGSWVPASDYKNSDALPTYFEKIAETTGGAVNWTLVPGGQLAGGVETFSAVQDGIMDAGVAVATYVPNLLPSLATLYNTVVPGNDPVAAAGAANEIMMLHCPSCIEEAQAVNAVALAGYAGAPFVLMCREPISSVDQLQGLRVRASGASYNALEMAGASVVQVSLVETVSLLQRGGIDCVAGVGDWLKTFGYGDTAKYVTDFSFGVAAPVVAFYMNRDQWQSMSDEGRAAHLRHAGYLAADHTINNFIVRNNATVADQIENNGVQMVETGADWTEMITAYEAAEIDINAAKAADLGLAPETATEIMTRYRDVVEKWRGISAEVGTDVDAFAEALWEEVYSKVDPNGL